MSNPNKDKIEYWFKALNPTDYEVKLKLEVKGQLFQNAFGVIKSKMEKVNSQVKNIDSNAIRGLGGFDVDKEHLAKFGFLFKTNTRNQFATLRMELKKDHIEILSNNIQKMRFEKDEKSGNWWVTLIFEGQYVDKR